MYQNLKTIGIVKIFLIEIFILLAFTTYSQEQTKIFCNDKDSTFENLQLFVKDKQIVAIGEATHNSKEFYEFRAKFSSLLIEKDSFKTIALEVGFSEVNKLNEYINSTNNDSIDIVEAIKDMKYWLYQTEEFKDFVNWVKVYNKINNNVITFYGVDVLFLDSTIGLLQSSLKTNNINKYELTLENIKNKYSNFYEVRAYPQKIYFTKKLEEILEYINIEDTTLMNQKTKELNVLRVKQLIYGLNSKKIGNRDYYMCKMLEEYIINNKTKKIIYWAHNDHVINSLKFKSSGYFLKEIYKNNFFTIGQFFLEGYFNAYNEKNMKFERMHVDKDKSLEYDFYSNCTNGYFFTNQSVFDKNYSFYSIGSSYKYGINTYSFVNLKDDFDAVVFYRFINSSNSFKKLF